MQGFLPFKYNRHSLDCTVSLLHDDLSQREIHWRYSRVFYVVNDRTWLRFLGLTMYGFFTSENDHRSQQPYLLGVYDRWVSALMPLATRLPWKR